MQKPLASLSKSLIPRFTASNATPKNVMEALRLQGCAIVERLIPENRMNRISKELEPHVASRILAADGAEVLLREHGNFMGNRTKRMLGVLGKSPSMSEMVAHPLVLGVADGLLAPYCERIQLHIGMFRRLCPGEDMQPLHQDRHSVPAMDLKPSEGEPGYFPGAQWGVAALWALSDCTELNGATRLIPGSHLRTDVNLDMTLKRTSAQEQEIGWTPSEEECLLATMPRGSVLLYPSATVHGASANQTEEMRDVCLFAYSPAWIRQEENMYLTTPPPVAAKLPQVVQELIGYSLHGQVLGMVDVKGDMGDPQDLLQELNVTTKASTASLPVLSRKTLQDDVELLRKTCEHTGFFYLADHGLEEKLQTAQNALRKFFMQPDEVKAQLGTEHSRVFPQHSRGWVAQETLDPSRQGLLDLKESLEVGLEKPQEEDPAARPFSGPNNWPNEVPELREEFMGAVNALHEISMEVATALEKCLDVEPGTFVKKCDDPMVLCRGLHYYTPLGSTQIDEAALGCSAHTDYGLISLLHQTAPGLQVLHAEDNVWMDVDPLPNSLVVNLGDLMQRWTNGRFKSTVHRVLPPQPGQRRQCIGFFLDANFDAIIEPLPRCIADGEAAKYPTVTAGQHKLAKFKVQSGAKLDVDSADFFQRTVDAPKEAVSRQGGA